MAGTATQISPHYHTTIESSDRGSEREAQWFGHASGGPPTADWNTSFRRSQPRGPQAPPPPPASQKHQLEGDPILVCQSVKLWDRSPLQSRGWGLWRGHWTATTHGGGYQYGAYVLERSPPSAACRGTHTHPIHKSIQTRRWRCRWTRTWKFRLLTGTIQKWRGLRCPRSSLNQRL